MILYPVRAGEVARIGPDQLRERYGVDPTQVPDFIALRGDPSDKIPGALGVGQQRAGQLVRRYETLDGVLAAGLFPMQAEALPSLSGDCHDGHVGALALARRSETDMGRRIRPRAPVGTHAAGRPPGRKVPERLNARSAAPRRNQTRSPARRSPPSRCPS